MYLCIMVNIENSIRKEYKIYPNRRTLVYVYLCKFCNKEIFIEKCQLKTSSGCCKKCYGKTLLKEKQTKGNKTCKTCLKSLDISKFNTRLLNKNSEYTCTKCNNLKREYGINSLEYDNLLEKQNYRCAICNKNETSVDRFKGNKISLAVDHCHKTGKIRGLLCGKCNRALGLLNDDKEILKNTIDYLIRNEVEEDL